jgi:hypothetical protein
MKSSGKPRTLAVLLAAAAYLGLGSLVLSADKDADAPSDPNSPEFARYVLEKVDDMEMKIKTKHWTRTLELESWSLGEDYSLVRILKPKKEKGSATLKAKNDLFTYLSKTGKTIKITSGMMGGSWMGSHFTNDDLVRNSRLSRDFKVKLIFNGPEKDGTEVYRFKCVPKPDVPVVWDKIVVTVRQSDLQGIRQSFYNEEGKKVRMMIFSNHKEVDGRVLPTRMVVKPLDGSGEYTRVTIKEIKFNVKIGKDFFSIQKLKAI